MATVLIIDDSRADRTEIRKMLADAGLFDRILEASDGLAGLKLLRSESIDVVVCDLMMPGLDGEKLLRAKDSGPGCPEVPFVFLTAANDLEHKARLLDEGASDVIDKPAHPANLVARLRKQLEIKWLQDKLLRRHEVLSHLSTTDSLTGLRNRRFLTEALTVEFTRAKRYRTPLTVLMLDLDHFKAVNDRFGHPTGDAVLQGVAEIVLSNTRQTDVVGRYGGDEILLILSHNDLAGGLRHAERLRENVEAASFEGPGGQTIRTTLSIGAATYHDDIKAPEDLVAAADAALYRAKQNGRNRVEAER